MEIPDTKLCPGGVIWIGIVHKRVRRYLVIFGIALVVLLVALSRSGKPSVVPAGKSDLFVTVLGFTNDPVFAPPPGGLALAGGGKGLHAIFGVTNTSTNEFIRFETVAVEWFYRGVWTAFDPVLEDWPTNLWRGLDGRGWPTGYGCAYAIAWPGISTNASWRLRISVTKEPTIVKQAVNARARREIFSPHRASIMVGPEVSILPRLQLLSGEAAGNKASATNK